MFNYIFKNKIFTQDEIIAVFFKIVSSFSLIISNVIVSRYFPNNQLSLFYLIVPTTTFFSMIFVSPITIYFTNESILQKTNLYKIINEYVLYLLFLSIILVIPLQFVLYKIEIITKIILCFYICVELSIGTISGMIIQNESINGNLKKSVLFNFLISFFTILFPIIVGFFFGWNVNSWIIGLIISRIFQIPLFNRFTFIKFSTNKINFKLLFFFRKIKINIKSIFKLAINSILSWLHNNFNVLFITLVLGLNDAAPFLYVYSISSTLANMSENNLKPILDRKLFTTIHGVEENKKEINPLFIYLFIAFFGFIIIPYIGNYLSKDRYINYMSLSRIFFVFELLRLFLYFKLSIFQIKFGYNRSLKINSLFLILYILSFSILLFEHNKFSAFLYIYLFLLVVVIVLINLIPPINKIKYITKINPN